MKLLVCFVCLVTAIGLSACNGTEHIPGEQDVTIGDILANSAKYENQQVTIKGEYRGWESGYGTAPVTRSDWVLKDSTGGIYVTGNVPAGYDPYEDRGKPVTVTGRVKILDGKPYLEARLTTP